MRSLLFHSPTGELIGIVLALALLSWVLIIRGIFLVLFAKVSRRLIVNAALLYLFFLVLSLIYYFMAGDSDSLLILVYPGFPFGLLAEIPLFFLAGRGSVLVPVLVAASWFLNFMACITIIYYVNKIIATLRPS